MSSRIIAANIATDFVMGDSCAAIVADQSAEEKGVLDFRLSFSHNREGEIPASSRTEMHTDEIRLSMGGGGSTGLILVRDRCGL